MRRSLVLLGGLLAGLCVAMPRGEPATGKGLYQRLLKSVAWIEANGRGTGFVVDVQRRWLVTCAHVVGERDQVDVVFPWYDGGLVVERSRYLGRRDLVVRGKVVRRSPACDLAMVEVPALPADAQALALADAEVGARVHLVGNRYDVDTLWTYATGEVRGRRTLRDGYFTAGVQLAKGARALLAGVPINAGDSGGPLVNDRAEVVGVAAAVAWEVQGAGLFIDAAEVRSLLGEPAVKGPQTGSDVYRATARGTVVVQYDGGPPRAGFLIDVGRRLVLTTARTVGTEPRVDVGFLVGQADAAWYRRERDLLRKKGAVSTGVVLAIDAARNLALVEVAAVPAGAADLPLAATSSQPGEAVHLVSHPRQAEVLWVYATGSVRQVSSTLLVQAPLGEGEEGGPVVDAAGKVVGLASGKVAAQQQVVYVTRVEEVRAFLDERRATAADPVARGERLLRARQRARALAAFETALALDPRHAAALLGRARMREMQGRPRAGLCDCDTVLSLTPDNPEALALRAALWSAAGHPRRARIDAEAAIARAPKLAAGYVQRGRALLALGEAVRAKADADEAVWLDGKLAAAYRLRGAALAHLGNLPAAVQDFTQAIALDPLDAEAYRLRGLTAGRQNDADAALADLTKAIELAPDDAAPYAARAWERLRQGDEPAAWRDAIRVACRMAGAKPP